ncbi:efflux RND transporter permease subunit [Diplocloster agilis]|uniref:efflux RND transporter permease subunit n=1 Tax=Diplocloster agilis TaxID=2850323 RepID=UPI0008215F14|nr:MMPL family transporter [Suonthocola fibrivorans]MCU6735646.1 MMPL family transporter [Suonthocola fibrivorans]SCJ78934.1 Putative membrane protein ydgH [uncultured Clostridium sp.]
MIKLAKKIVKHKKIIVALYMLLLIPSVIGIAHTRVNYDLLSYLPDSLETVEGQNIMVDEFGMGAFSMVIVEDMQPKDVVKLKEQIAQVEHVKEVIWYDDVMDITVPMEMLPEDIRNAFNHGDATMMIALFDNTTSSDETMTAISQMRDICNQQCFISGMSGIVTDIKNLSLQEMPVYVVIAALLSLVVLTLTMESFLIPLIFLFSIGVAILYNLGSNVVIGEISYITQALTAVLQLGVTMDYSIFLLNSYEDNKLRFPGEKDRAMAHAISNTFKSITGSSVTTIAGFAALCFMSFTLGRDIGVVMMKGVVIGVLCCVTLLPCLILLFDKWIEKTHHKPLVPNLDKISGFITRHYAAFILFFLVLLLPSLWGNNHVGVYYNIDKSLPQTLPSNMANAKLEEDFDMNTIHMVLLKNGLTNKEKDDMVSQIDEVKGVKYTLGMNSLVGPGLPDEMIPSDLKDKIMSDHYEIIFVCSDYKTATEEVNAQITQIEKIVKSFSPESMVVGEAPLTKDLEDVTSVDFRNVNIASIAAIFLIIMIVFKSISLPVILVAVIEFAICMNMAIPYYMGTTLPFVASVVIGTIQLGATVDYAILMTSRYQKERGRGKSKKDAISIAHKTSMKSILISGFSFFAATFGVGLYSKIDMISSICTLLSRGAIISMIIVICILPSMFIIFDKVICKTSIGFLAKEPENEGGK